MPRPSAAQALFGHLPQRSDTVAKRQDNTTVAETMFPQLSRQQKAWDEFRERDRQNLLKHLRELNRRK